MSGDKHGHGYADSKHRRLSARGHGTRYSATKNGHTPEDRRRGKGYSRMLYGQGNRQPVAAVDEMTSDA